MFIEKEQYYEINELKNLPVKAIFTKKNFDFTKINPKEIKKIKELIINKKKKLVWANQTHSNNIKILKNDDLTGKYTNIDGFITKRKDVVILMRFADCLPIYIYDPVTNVYGLIHAGWKGSYNGIQKRAINIMEKNFKSKLADILIFLGIGIENRCYEVGKEFFKKFQDEYGQKINCCFIKLKQKYFFDNLKFNEMMLLEEGIKKGNIKKSTQCTFCNKNLHSYRRDGVNAGRNAGMIFWDK